MICLCSAVWLGPGRLNGPGLMGLGPSAAVNSYSDTVRCWTFVAVEAGAPPMKVERQAGPCAECLSTWRGRKLTVGKECLHPSSIWAVSSLRMLLGGRAWMPGNGAGGGRALRWRASTKPAGDRWLGPPGPWRHDSTELRQASFTQSS